MRRWIILILWFFLFARAATAVSHSVVLTWVASPDTGVTYNVFRLVGSCPASGTVGFTQLNTTPITVLTYTDTAVTVGNSYCYYATAVLGGFESVPSNLAPVVILPAPPTALTAASH
jgi:hypothetical protein